MPSPERRELALAVPAAGHDLQQRRMLAGAGLVHAADELRREQLRRLDDGVDLLRAVGAVRVLQQRAQVLLELGVGLGLALEDHRLVEVAVAQLAGLVGDHRVAALGGELETVEHAAELVADGADELVGVAQAPLEDRHHGGAGERRRGPGRRTGGSTPPRARACGRGCRRRSATSARCSRRDEALGQPLGLGVERAQERVQVLLRAVQQLALRIVAGAAERAHVGEDVEQPVLALDQLGAAAAVAQRRERAADLVTGDVVAEQHPAQAVERGGARRVVVGARRRRSRRARRTARRPRPRSASSCSSGVCAGTCTLVPVSTRRTRPANGAVSEVSIFIDSTTATTSPSATSSPSLTGIATTTDGPWLRTKPPSSRVIRCGTPWTSTSRSTPWREIIVRCVSPRS